MKNFRKNIWWVMKFAVTLHSQNGKRRKAHPGAKRTLTRLRQTDKYSKQDISETRETEVFRRFRESAFSEVGSRHKSQETSLGRDVA